MQGRKPGLWRGERHLKPPAQALRVYSRQRVSSTTAPHWCIAISAEKGEKHGASTKPRPWPTTPPRPRPRDCPRPRPTMPMSLATHIMVAVVLYQAPGVDAACADVTALDDSTACDAEAAEDCTYYPAVDAVEGVNRIRSADATCVLNSDILTNETSSAEESILRGMCSDSVEDCSTADTFVRTVATGQPRRQRGGLRLHGSHRGRRPCAGR